MERNIYLTAVNDLSEGGNFYRTVINGITPLRDNIGIPEDGKEKTNLWGITEKSTTTFEKITKGSIILFYHKGYIVGYSIVKHTLVDKDLSMKIWGTFLHGVFKEKTYWSNILILSEFTPLRLNFAEIIKLGNYSPKFSVRRILKLNTDATTNILKKYKTFEAFFTLHKQ